MLFHEQVDQVLFLNLVERFDFDARVEIKDLYIGWFNNRI